MNAVTNARPSKLRGVTPTSASPGKSKTLIYGAPGVGKTWTALDFPACYYMDTEGGARLPEYTAKLQRGGGVYVGPEQGSTEFSTIIDQVRALATERHGFKTFVLDSVSKVFALEIDREAKKLGDKDAFGASKKPAVGYMRSLVAEMMRADMNAIITAYEKDEWGKDEKGNREVTGQTYDAWDRLGYELDLVLHIVRQGPSRIARVKKSRLAGFPDGTAFPWSYAEFANRYGRDLIEGEVKPIVLADPDQVAEAKRLLDAVKMPDGWLERCLEKGRASTLEDMEAAAVAAMIKTMNERVQA